jgi:hypothetical protein
MWPMSLPSPRLEKVKQQRLREEMPVKRCVGKAAAQDIGLSE